MTDPSFTANLAALARQARSDMSHGPLAGADGTDPVAVTEVLNYALAEQIVCWLRHARLGLPAGGSSSMPGADTAQVPEEIVARAQQELGHAARIVDRISELGGDPDLDPANLTGRPWPGGAAAVGGSLTGVLREDLAAEWIVISTYRDIIRWLGDTDIYSRRMLESILEEEQRHADEILDLLGALADMS